MKPSLRGALASMIFALSVSGCGDDALDGLRRSDEPPGSKPGCTSGEQVTNVERALDVILVVDNSRSMRDEIESVQRNINASFAQVLEDSGSDYRVLALSRHGPLSDMSVCISAPLAGTTCDPVPSKPSSTERFRHYSVEIDSHNTVCRVLMTLDGIADEFDLMPAGWRAWLRPDALQVFVAVTDDGMDCSAGGDTFRDSADARTADEVAARFDRALRAESPATFERGAERDYVWHSIVGFADQGGGLRPEEGYVSEVDPASEDPGVAYQALSRLTGGLRFSIADHAAFGEVLRDIALDAVTRTSSCSP